LAETLRIHSSPVSHATIVTRARYDRLAPFYDAMESFMERSVFGELRQQLWSRVFGERLLEVGVGTGKNMAYYPDTARVTGVDLSEGMLERAKRRARALGLEADLRLMDAQRLAFSDDTFDTAVATFVFCSVPDPCLGLRELGRVVKTGGDIWLLEHVRLNRPVSGRIMDLLNPFVVRVMGANINRRTVENVRAAGLVVDEVSPAAGELVQLIHAKPGDS
jgi:phosphatidylethanolamine/phosphatidyl-N-methylethanolamine N-methyltransferase